MTLMVAVLDAAALLATEATELDEIELASGELDDEATPLELTDEGDTDDTLDAATLDSAPQREDSEDCVEDAELTLLTELLAGIDEELLDDGGVGGVPV